MNEQYGKVIDALMSPNLDYKKIAINLAKINPEVFLICLNYKEVKTEQDLPAFEFNILQELKSRGIIHAIKLYRATTNKGLKDSKDAVEALRDSFIKEGYLPSGYINTQLY